MRLIVGREYILDGSSVKDEFKNEKCFLVSYQYEAYGDASCFIRFANTEKLGDREYYCEGKDLELCEPQNVEIEELL